MLGSFDPVTVSLPSSRVSFIPVTQRSIPNVNLFSSIKVNLYVSSETDYLFHLMSHPVSPT